MYLDIDVQEALNRAEAGIPLVDLRSHGEYVEATIPGAYNIPLLDNVERSLVGITHKKEGAERARELAMEILSPRLPYFIYAFKQLAAPGKEVVIFCWRGGERSHFAGCLLDAMGFKVYRIRGGYKAYRRYVLAYLDREILPHRAVVVYGLTGVGKTDILQELKRRGYPVLDLETLAAHRGSVFGKIGQPPSPSQKMFEALIERELRIAENRGFFLVECESKRLGKLLVPDLLLNTMQNGYRILLYASLQARVDRIMRDYAAGPDNNKTALQEAVVRLTKYLGKSKVAELNGWLERGLVSRVVEYLLLHYYDPLYKYPGGPSSRYHLSVNTENLQKAVKEITDFINRLPEYRR